MARKPNKRIARQAQDWFIRLESATLSPEDQQRFANWLDKSPAHRAAYRQLDEFSQCLVGVEKLAALSTLPTTGLEPLDGDIKKIDGWLRELVGIQRPAFVLVGVVLLTLSVSLFYLSRGTVGEPTKQYSTRTAQISEIELTDGSVVNLGARSQFSVRYNNTERKVVFMGGEAYFDVVSDPERPFIVQYDDMQVQVLGTEFNIRADSIRFNVAVAEGKIKVSQPGESLIPFWGQFRPEERMLAAGEQMEAVAGKFEKIAAVNIDEIGEWRRGKLIYHKALLGEVIADIRRYVEGDIVFVTPKLAELRLSAVLGADQIDNTLAALPALLPVDIDRSIPGTLVIKRKQNDK